MKFKLSGNLIRFADFRSELEVPGPTLEKGILKLVETYPNLKTVLLDETGRFRAIHRLFLNGEIVDNTELGQATQPADEVNILTSIAGR